MAAHLLYNRDTGRLSELEDTSFNNEDDGDEL
jgi:hypothetical protein